MRERELTSPMGEEGVDGNPGEGRPRDAGRPSLRLGREMDSERLWECRRRDGGRGCGEVGRLLRLGEDRLLRGDPSSRSSGENDLERRTLGGRPAPKRFGGEDSRMGNDGRSAGLLAPGLAPKLNEFKRAAAAPSRSEGRVEVSTGGVAGVVTISRDEVAVSLCSASEVLAAASSEGSNGGTSNRPTTVGRGVACWLS
jgi:hypothetical protein